MTGRARPIFAANWKMHHGPKAARAFLRSFLAHSTRRTDRQVIFFPPALTLTTVVEALRDRREILVGVQNIHWEDKGAFTGENSAPIARDAGASLALVGHSERRHVFGESDDESARKVAAAVRAGLTPMLCIGERLEERERGDAESVVLRQLRAGVSRIQPQDVAEIMVAYEPVWAIGTGKNATPEDAAAMHGIVRAELHKLIGDRADAVPLLYGGSVKLGNVASLLAAQDVDGVLVGGASLDAEGWAAIVRA